MTINQPYNFIEPYDKFAVLINEKANELYQSLKTLDITNEDLDETSSLYLTRHHLGRRLVFSIESSADIIYRSVQLTEKKIENIIFLDYGAGLGTLFLLAGKLGFKGVFYNDYFSRITNHAKIICNKLNIKIDGFISGDIDDVIGYGKSNDITFDILASRNVIEHIYNLEEFYTKLYQSDITGTCYATTTANYHNPAMRLRHYWLHYTMGKKYHIPQRIEYIKELVPDVNAADLINLTKVTRGKAFRDFTDTLNCYLKKEEIPHDKLLSTNTCDCRTGVWAEHLIKRKDYETIIHKAGFTLTYTAGFWDTHYKYTALNLFAGFLNKIIKATNRKTFQLAPFINIVAIKKA